MIDLPLHDLNSAPDASRRRLAVLAASPALLEGYMTLSEQLLQHGALTREEQTIVMLTVSREHGCSYCVPVYTRNATRLGLDPDVIKAVRNGDAIADARLAALRDFTVQLLQSRGRAAAALQAAGELPDVRAVATIAAPLRSAARHEPVGRRPRRRCGSG